MRSTGAEVENAERPVSLEQQVCFQAQRSATHAVEILLLTHASLIEANLQHVSLGNSQNFDCATLIASGQTVDLGGLGEPGLPA